MLPNINENFEVNVDENNDYKEIFMQQFMQNNINSLKFNSKKISIFENESSKIEETIKLLNKDDYKPIVYQKPIGVVRGFTASSFQNLMKNNDDRITLATNLKVFSNELKSNPSFYSPVINLYAIYDGHNGFNTTEKLRDNLYKYIIYDEDFLIKTSQSIINSFRKIDEEIKVENTPGTNLYNYKKENRESKENPNVNSINLFSSFGVHNFSSSVDNSGASVLICLIINNICYIANLGKTRAILSHNIGEKVFLLSKEHDMNNEAERDRIIRSGGTIYNKNNVKRIKPGDLFSGRSIGDIPAKLTINLSNRELKQDLYLNVPDILKFELSAKDDFIILLSDSVYEKLSNSEITSLIYITLIEVIENKLSLDYLYSLCIQNIFKNAIKRGVEENLTCVILFFENFIDLFINKNSDKIKKKIEELKYTDKVEFYNDKDNLLELKLYENILNSQINNNNKNYIINNINNNISITKETKIYCCCFKKNKKKITNNTTNEIN